MKKLILLCFLLFAEAFPQSTYTVEIQKTDQCWEAKSEWRLYTAEDTQRKQRLKYLHELCVYSVFSVVIVNSISL